MAVRTSGKPLKAKSTGAVETPTEPVTTEQTADISSTDAVEFPSEPVTTKVEHHGQGVVVNYETPGPVTMTVGWLSDDEIIRDEQDGDGSAGEGTVETKVVEAPEPSPRHSADVDVQTK